MKTKQDDSHLDSRFSYDAFLPVEQPKARLEILTWWKIERLIEDENCNFDKNFIVSYFDERVKATNNQLLKYRYNYFISLLTNDNRYAKQSIDALIAVINTLLPKDKEDYPHVAEKAIEVLMSLIKRVKYKIPEATDLIWGGKETAEHATIVDLIRNDLSMVAEQVRVVRYRYCDRLETNKGPIFQTSSEICGVLPNDYPSHIGDIIFRLLPAGSITGAPQIQDDGYY